MDAQSAAGTEGSGSARAPVFALQAAHVAEAAAMEAVERVIEQGGLALYDRYLQTKEVEHTVGRIMGDLDRAIAWSFMRPDVAVHEEERKAGWEPEPEPEPAPVDAWARATVPLKPPSRQAAMSLAAAANASAATGAASASGQSARSRFTWRSRGRKSRATTPLDSKPRVQIMEATPVRSVAEAEMDDASLRAARVADAARDQLLREMAQRERAERERREQAEARAKEAAERQERLARELRGKEYTLDRTGKVIVIARVKPDRLPRPVTPRVEVVREEAEQLGDAAAPSQQPQQQQQQQQQQQSQPPPSQPQPHGSRRGASTAATASPSRQAARQGSQRRSASHRTGRRKREGTEGTPELSEEFFRDKGSFQPLLRDTIMLSPGVILHEGQATVEGPLPPSDPLHMTRRQFSDLVDVAGRGDERVARPVTAEARLPASAAHGPPAGEGVAAGAAAAQLQPVRGWEPAAAASAAGAPSSPAALPALAGSVFALDGTLGLLNSPDWGVNPRDSRPYQPPSLPGKPDSRHRQHAVGRKPINPRDRPFVHRSPPKRLPPPPIPATVGHGMHSPDRDSLTPSPARAGRLPPITTPRQGASFTTVTSGARRPGGVVVAASPAAAAVARDLLQE